MMLHLTDLSSEPLHSQISRQIRAQLLAGEWVEGSPLPSIRGLARDQRISVITVQRAYEDLEREGLIHARRGKGFFATSMSGETRAELAEDRFRKALDQLLVEARAEGLTPRNIKDVFTQLLREKEKK